MYRQALFKQGIRPGVLTLAVVQQRQREERPGDVLLEAYLSVERQRLLRHRASRYRVTPHPGDIPQRKEGERHAPWVSDFPIECQAPLRQRLCPLIVALNKCQVRGSEERLGTNR